MTGEDWEARKATARIANCLLREGYAWPEVIPLAEAMYAILTKTEVCDNNYLT